MPNSVTRLISLHSIRLVCLLSVSCLVWCSASNCGFGQSFTLPTAGQLNNESKPWVFWYWMRGAVSSEGITSDLEAMKAVGIGGAYLMPIMGPGEDPPFEPPALQLTDYWWSLVQHAMKEARRLDLEFAMHACDGFALAGGPWITPSDSMQQVVWSVTAVQAESPNITQLPQPPTKEGYYRDIAVLAIPVPADFVRQIEPSKVTSDNTNAKVDFLAIDDQHAEQYVSKDPGWIQYEYEQPVTIRSLTIRTRSPTIQAHRFVISVSNDGSAFREIAKLSPPRHGWQDGDASTTHAIPPTTARFFRFEFDPAGSEPGSEDLDSAKWKPTLKLTHLILSPQPRIHQFEGKSGAVWRVADDTDDVIGSPSPDDQPGVFPRLDSVLDLTEQLASDGTLQWTAPEGIWLVFRIGHTSTGHKNETAGGGKGLECDKLNAAAVNLQFDQWYGKILEQIGPEAANEVLKVFHVDSWECGSQNWTHDFESQFQRRRGYSLRPWLPIFAGLPIDSFKASEQVLLDVRITINELLQERFFGTLKARVQRAGDLFSAESVAPTMLCDSLEHFRSVDIPMGEFWLDSPTHDKPNDMFDAISGAHIYGKNIVQAESFTQLKMQWNEHPGMLKRLGDQQFARGMNRIVFHVFCQNPSTDRKPGITLNGVGLYFQRDQTWWNQSTGWLEYLRRCQHLLQQGDPVCELAVFTGEELPRRSLLPQQLIGTLPGLFDPKLLAAEEGRMLSGGVALQEKPAGVVSTAGILDLDTWSDPLGGYKYDSLNRDQFLKALVDESGRIELPSGTTYEVIVFPAARAMSRMPGRMSLAVLRQLDHLLRNGGRVVLCERPNECIIERSEGPDAEQQAEFQRLVQSLYDCPLSENNGLRMRPVGKGFLIDGPVTASTLEALNIQPHLKIVTSTELFQPVAFMHRTMNRTDPSSEELYFVANRTLSEINCKGHLRRSTGFLSVYDPANNRYLEVNKQLRSDESVPIHLEPHGSLFLLISKDPRSDLAGIPWITNEQTHVPIAMGPHWRITFGDDERLKGVELAWSTLQDWKSADDKRLASFSGTASYENSFAGPEQLESQSRYILRLGQVHQLAEVWLNEQPCGIAWKQPYEVDITDQLKAGENHLRIEVTNTWRNRLIYESQIAEDARQVWTLAPLKLENTEPDSGGLLGPISLMRLPCSDLLAR